MTLARPLALALLSLALFLASGCAATIREEAGRGRPPLPRGTAARLLGRGWERLDRGKRIFDIRLTDRARVLNGEGAIVYEKEPLRLRLDVFGPHASPVLSLAQIGDTMTVRLYEEREFVAGQVGDPAFGELTGGATFTGPEVLGALLGAYDPAALAGWPADTAAYAQDGELVVALLQPDRAHRFAYAASDSTLREYRQERGGRIAYRVRFSDYRTVEGLRRPSRVELQDVAGRRTVRADVRSESFQTRLPESSYRLEPFS